MTSPQKATPVGAPANADYQETSAVILHDAERKRRARLPAVAALAGIELRLLADGRWLASRWNLSKELDDHEVEAWLQRVGVQI